MFERKERDALPGPDDLWTRLSVPWRACVELAWEAYQAGSLPIGAVVADAEGKVLSRGRNRIHEGSGEDGHLFGHKLAHAELNALVTLDNDACDSGRMHPVHDHGALPALRRGAAHVRRGWGALRCEGALGRLGGDVRDRALPQTRQREGNSGPRTALLEDILVALLIERFLRLKPEILGRFLDTYEAIYAPGRGGGKAPVPFRRARGDRRGRRAGHDLGRRK